MVIGWVIIKSHVSGKTEIYARDDSDVAWYGYFTTKISDRYIFKTRWQAELEFSTYTNTIIETFELVPVEAYL